MPPEHGGIGVEHLDLECVAAFLAVLDERHFARAASRLHLTPPGVSRRVQRLEKQVGAVLLERDGAGVVGATSVGRRFTPAARQLLEQERSARRVLREGVETHTVRLGVPGVVGDYPFPPQLRAIARRLRAGFPASTLSCVGVPQAELARCLSEDRVDVLWTAALDQPDDALDHEPLMSVARVGAVGARHPLAGAKAVAGEDFAALPMLVDPAAPAAWMSLWILGDLRPRREARLTEVVARDSTAVLRALGSGQAATGLHAPISENLPPHVQLVDLIGVPEVQYVAARRRGDDRDLVLGLVAAMKAVAAAGAGTRPEPERGHASAR